MVKVFIVHLLEVVLNLGSVDVSVKTEDFPHLPEDQTPSGKDSLERDVTG
jgi:hypothetical protein